MKLFVLFALFVFFSGCCFLMPPDAGGAYAPGAEVPYPNGGDEGGQAGGANASGGSSAGGPPSPRTIGPVSEPTIVYFEPGEGGFAVEMDGISNSVYDRLGVLLRPGESADPADPQSLFLGDYPAHSPRDLVIRNRVMSGDRELQEWRQQVAEGNLERKNLVVVITDSRMFETGRITYTRAWPSAYSLAVTSGTLEETVSISSETVQ
ncbi:MAG TPA: hypothetical protein PKJ97_03425 [Candidatus Bilamarchaeaceae archaeon]|nr:hypothetical protein [Candidatus Bilamarchaeaceae archaeon]